MITEYDLQIYRNTTYINDTQPNCKTNLLLFPAALKVDLIRKRRTWHLGSTAKSDSRRGSNRLFHIAPYRYWKTGTALEAKWCAGVVACVVSSVEELGVERVGKKFSIFSSASFVVLLFWSFQERRRNVMKSRSLFSHSVLRPASLLSSLACAMSPLSYALAISSVALLLPRDGVDAFVQPRANVLGTGKSYSIMSKTVMSASLERRAFVSQVVSGGLGALALGSTTERATAYEVRQARGMLICPNLLVVLFCSFTQGICLPYADHHAHDALYCTRYSLQVIATSWCIISMGLVLLSCCCPVECKTYYSTTCSTRTEVHCSTSRLSYWQGCRDCFVCAVLISIQQYTWAFLSFLYEPGMILLYFVDGYENLVRRTRYRVVYTHW